MAANDGVTGEDNLQEESMHYKMPDSWDKKLNPILAILVAVCHEEFIL